MNCDVTGINILIGNIYQSYGIDHIEISEIFLSRNQNFAVFLDKVSHLEM